MDWAGYDQDFELGTCQNWFGFADPLPDPRGALSSPLASQLTRRRAASPAVHLPQPHRPTAAPKLGAGGHHVDA